MAGYTSSDNFPTTQGAFDTSWNGASYTYYNAFISKLSNDLTQLLASTYLGGSGWNGDVIGSLIIGSAGNIYVTGSTDSTDFPITPDAYATIRNGNGDAFVTKLSEDLSKLLASTFLGGDSSDYGISIVADSNENIYVTGVTASPNFPTTDGTYDVSNDGSYDGFISKFNSNLTTLLASTFLGGSATDSPTSIVLDPSENIYVAGSTLSSDFPTTSGAYDASYNGNSNGNNHSVIGDAFVAKLSNDLKNLLASTYLGGTDYEGAFSIALDKNGSIYVTGWTGSADFPVSPDAYQTSLNGLMDGFVSKLNTDLTTLLASTYLGGTENDNVGTITIKSTGSIYIAGHTRSSDFPVTTGSYDTSFNGLGCYYFWGCFGDAFIAKLFLPNSLCLGNDLFIDSLRPERGGDIGDIKVYIYGCNFKQGAKVKLVRTDQADIIGDSVSVSDDGHTITTIFDLAGKARGLWDISVTNTDETSYTMPEALTIEEGRAPQFWASLLGRTRLEVMGGRPHRFSLVYGNLGNVDVPGAMMWVRIPAGVEVIDTHLSYTKDIHDETILQIPVSHVPPDLTQSISFTLKPPVKITSDVIESTDNYLNVAVHVTDSKETGDVTIKMNVSDTTKDIEPKVDVVETTDEIEYVYDAIIKVGESYSSTIQSLYGEYAPGVVEPKPPKGRRQVRMNIRGTRRQMCLLYNICIDNEILEGASNAIDIYEDASEFANTVQAITSAVTDATVKVNTTNTMVESGMLDQSEADTLNRLARGGATITIANRILPENTPLADVREGLEHMMVEAWERRIYLADFRSGVYFSAFCDEFKKTINLDCWSIMTQEYLNEALRRWYLKKQYIASKSGNSGLRFETLISGDPNEKVGSQGSGEQQYTSGVEPLRYTVYFENKSDASAAAQEITITDQLDKEKMDFSTFGPGTIAFGEKQVSPKAGLREYSKEVDLRPSKDLIVRINVILDKDTGLVTWHLIAIDPTTCELPEDPSLGILPPNKTPPEGEGSVIFTIMPKKGLATGTEVRNKATIVFDVNPPIDTNEWLNTIDNTKPSSSVQALAAIQDSADFTVEWSGTDVGSGIKLRIRE